MGVKIEGLSPRTCVLHSHPRFVANVRGLLRIFDTMWYARSVLYDEASENRGFARHHVFLRRLLHPHESFSYLENVAARSPRSSHSHHRLDCDRAASSHTKPGLAHVTPHHRHTCRPSRAASSRGAPSSTTSPFASQFLGCIHVGTSRACL